MFLMKIQGQACVIKLSHLKIWDTFIPPISASCIGSIHVCAKNVDIKERTSSLVDVSEIDGSGESYEAHDK